MKKKPRSKETGSGKTRNDPSVQHGVLSFAEGDEICVDFAVECSNCGTLTEFFTERCPMCGMKFETADSGLVSMFRGMDFDTSDSSEIACPVCGETIHPSRGKCPKCKEPIGFIDSDDPSAKVDPIVRDDNIVFVHLDVESGEVNCLQRVENDSGFEHLSVQLETIGQGEFDRERKGVSRM